MTRLNLSYTTCFLPSAVADYLYCMPLSIVDLCLTGIQVHSTSILVAALIRLDRLERLRINGVATMNDSAFEQV